MTKTKIKLTNEEKRKALIKRVQKLFSKTLPFEFKTYPNENEVKERTYYLTPNKTLFRKIDLTIENESEIYLVMECKNVSRKPTISDIADRLKTIKRDQKAKAGLIIISGVKISKEEIKDIHEKYGIFLWNDELLCYYEKVAYTLELFSFFEIMKSFNIELEQDSGENFRPAVSLKQTLSGEELDLVAFTAYPREMIPRCYVFRHANKNEDSYQRLLKKDKLNKIAGYINQGGNIINSIIVLLPKSCKFKSSKLLKSEEWYSGVNVRGTLGRICLPRKYCFIELIDGQHRLFSFTKCSEEAIKNFPLNFIGVVGGKKEIARDLFITINQKAKKIDANLLASIQEGYDKDNLKEPESLAREIVRELNRNKYSELKDKILIGEKVTEQQFDLKIYIAMLSYNAIRPLIKDGGSLKKIIKKDEVSPYYQLINLFLKRVKAIFPEEYQDTKKYVVFTNNGLIPLLRLLGNMGNFYRKKPSQQQIDSLLEIIRDYSWSLSYIKGRSSGAGWKKTYDGLIRKIKKVNKFKNFPKKQKK